MANATWTRRFLALAVAVAALPRCIVDVAADERHERDKHSSQSLTIAPSTRAAYLQLPLRFEPAQHQASGGSTFVARGAGYAVSVSAARASLLLKDQPGAGPRTVRMSLVGGNDNVRPNVRRRLAGVSNYLIGNDRRRWVTGVRGYGEIEYRGVYRGVDIVYYGNQQELEYDFVVASGVSPDVIALAFDGATRVSVNPDGDLVIATDSGSLVQHRPALYQNDRGARRDIDGGYVIRRDGTIGFRVGKYDHRLPLVIDPVLSYATYLGGVNQDRGNSVAVDAAGNVIVAGVTYSPDFPVGNALQPQKGGFGDAFVAKLNPAGDALVYSTYVGGGGGDEARGVAVDESGNAYVAGYTDSWDFPATSTIGPPEWRKNVFVIKLDVTGVLTYATEIGGSGSEDVHGIAVDAGGRAHIVGMTSSPDFPVVDPWQRSLGGHPAFRTHDSGAVWAALNVGFPISGVGAFGFDRSQPGAVYAGSIREGLFKSVDDGATWTQAGLPPQRIYAIVDQAGTTPAVFAAGDFGLYRSRDHGESWTAVSQHQLLSAVAVTQESQSVVYAGMGWSANIQKSMDGGETWIDTDLAGPVQVLAASGSTVYAVTGGGAYGGDGAVYRSSDGGPWEAANGSGHDVPIGMIMALAVDPTNPQVAYVGTNYGLFKTTSGGASWTSVWDYSTFVTSIVIAPSDPSTMYAAIGGGLGITHDGGQTWSGSGLPNVGALAIIAFDPVDNTHVYAGCYLSPDAFVATLSADGSRVEYGTYIGGAGVESATSIAVDSSGNRYVTGDTFSEDFPTVQPIQSAFGGTWDTFVVKLSAAGVPVYSTYLGGWETDYSSRIAVDGAGRAYVTGLTLSTNFPVLNAAQPVHGGGFSDAFVTALNESGSAFVYSTFLGGAGMENDWSQSLGPSIAVSNSGEAAVTGTTQSTNFPVTADAWHRTHAGGVNDVFVTTFDAAGARQYSTLLGGPGADYPRGVALDSTGTIVIAGYTDSTDWATRTALQPANAGSEDAFVARISPGATPPDTTAPTTSIALSGTPGIPGWYKSPVTVSLSAVDNDGGRGLAYIEYRLTGGVFKRYTGPFTVTQSGTTQVTVRAVDWAGNVESPSPTATVAIDTTGPIVSFQVTGTFGLAGWLKSPATVTVFAVDPLGTGVTSVEYRIGDAAFQGYTAPFIVAAEGVTQVTARATDRNGNVSTSTRTVSIDTSAPRTSLAVLGTAGLAGWYTSPVTVSVSGLDIAPGSGVAIVEYSVNGGAFQTYASPFVVSAQGPTRITSRSRDRAGNIETPLPPTVIQIDSSAPVVTMTSPEARDYQHSESMVVSFSAADSMSGLQSVSAALDGGAVQNTQSILLLTQTLGTHTMEVFAVDVAGNPARQSMSFRVVATIDSLIASVNIYTLQGKIADSNTKTLLSKLNDANAALSRGNTSAASGKLRDFIDYCNAQSGRGIAADAVAVLAADAAYVLGTF